MPPKARKPEVNPFVEETPEDKKTESLDLGDAVALKRALDDAVVEAVQKQGHVLDHSLVDARIGLGLAACLVAGVAQLWPAKRPSSWAVLLACVVAYACLTLALTLLALAVEKDSIARTQGGPERPALIVSTTLPKWSDQYTLLIASRGIKAGSSSSKLPVTSRITRGLGDLVHSDGVVAVDKVHKEVEQLLAQLESGTTKEQ